MKIHHSCSESKSIEIYRYQVDNKLENEWNVEISFGLKEQANCLLLFLFV